MCYWAARGDSGAARVARGNVDEVSRALPLSRLSPVTVVLPTSIWLGFLSWLCALAGILLVADDTHRHEGVALLLLAGAAAIAAWGRMETPTGHGQVGGTAALFPLSRERVPAVIGTAASGAIVLVADIWFTRHQEEAFGIAGSLWLVGMGTLIVCAADLSAPAQSPADSTRSLWLRMGGTPRQVVFETLAVAALLIVALVLRVWNLQGIPFAIHPDEIITGRVATTAYLGESKSSVFTTVWNGINLPALWFAAVAASLHLEGHTLAALRLPAALFGAATIVPFYGMVREAWGRIAALAGTAVLAVSASQVQFSRVTLNNIVTPFFWAACFYFVIRGMRRGKPLDWALAGMAAGISEYGYYGTHLLPFVLLVFVVYLVVVHGKRSLDACLNYLLLALGYVVAFGPLLAYYVLNPDIYFGRGQGVLTWDHIPRSWADLQLMWATLWPLMSENLLGLSAHTDQGTLYWAPLLLPVEAALLVLGTALLLWHWRDAPAFLMLVAGCGTLFVGGTLVHGVPFFEHWTPAFPAFYAAVALPLGLWGEAASALPMRQLRRGLLALLAAGVLLIAWLDIDFYFNRYQVTRPEFEIRAAQSRWEAGLGPTYRVFTVGPTWQPYDPETNSYLVAGQEGAALDHPHSQLPLPPERGKGLAFVFFADNQRYEPLVRRLYSGGVTGEVHSHGGVHFFYTYVVPPARVHG